MWACIRLNRDSRQIDSCFSRTGMARHGGGARELAPRALTQCEGALTAIRRVPGVGNTTYHANPHSASLRLATASYHDAQLLGARYAARSHHAPESVGHVVLRDGRASRNCLSPRHGAPCPFLKLSRTTLLNSSVGSSGLITDSGECGNINERISRSFTSTLRSLLCRMLPLRYSVKPS